jgi:16S rRNA (uracil1498-N3)-methyltransferase
MHKFFVDKSSINDNKIYITNDDVNHIYKVLRLDKEDMILICDGACNEYTSKIIDINKKEVVCEILESNRNSSEPPISITLYQGLPKAQKMELIIQKGVEIGICRFQPVITHRVVVKTEGKDLTGKLERYKRISEEAAKQSNRGMVPEILEPISFEAAIEELKAKDLSIVPYEKERAAGLKAVLKSNSNAKNIGIFIGPEGGFEEAEIELCLANNILPVTLGPRILRTETAGISVAGMVLYELGDMGSM